MKKIAFCFLIYDEIAHEELWNDFFKDIDPEKYSIYIHYKNYKPMTYFDKYRLDKCLPTAHAHVSLIHAYNLLFQTAYKDEENIKFCILSGTCVPFKSFDYIYDFLTKDEKAHFNKCPKEQCFPRCNSILQHYPSDIIQKSSGWFILNRKIVKEICFISPGWIDMIYTYIPAPEEHFYITETYNRKLNEEVIETPNLAEGATTFTNWPDMNYKYVGSGHLKNYTSITVEELNHLMKSPCLFGRKFLKECVLRLT